MLDQMYYTWKEKFINGGKMALSVSKHENINQNLQSENERLKKLIGELTIVNDVFKKTLEARRRKGYCDTKNNCKWSEYNKSPKS